jgi:hypothetical protein
LLSFSAVSRAQTAGASFLTVPSSPRAYALGQTNIAALGAEAVGRNPANLGLMTDRVQLFSSVASVIGGAQYGHVSLAYAPADGGIVDALGLAVTRLQSSGFPEADANGDKTGGAFGVENTAVALSASRNVSFGLRAGVTVKAIESRIAGYGSGLTPAADAGLTYTFSPFTRPVTVAASVTNVGTKIKFIDQRDSLPTSLNMGAAVPLGPVLAVLEVNRMAALQRTEFGGGLELPVGPAALRAGYLFENSGTDLAARDKTGAASLLQGLTFGAGLRVGSLKADYAFGQQGVDYGMTQRIALTLMWGGPERKVSRIESRRFDRAEWLEDEQ